MDAFGAFIRSQEFVALGRYAGTRRAAGQEFRPIKESSAKIYMLMFGTYLRWLGSRKLKLHEITPAGIQTFLDAAHVDKNNRVRKVHSLIRLRYLRLLERVYDHMCVMPNPAKGASFAVVKASRTGKDKEKAYLSEAQQAAFLDNLPVAKPFDERDPTAPSWKKRRDRAMLAMMLGSGLTVSEVINLDPKYVRGTEKNGAIPIRIPSYANNGKARDTLVRPFAAKHVLPWIEERKMHHIPSNFLFPASLTTKSALNKATVYRHVKSVLESTGLIVERKGGRTLRNSFAIRELETGSSLELVKQYMGHHELRSTEKYAITQPAQKRLNLALAGRQSSASEDALLDNHDGCDAN